MPLYDYHCPCNGQTVTVRHGIHVQLTTWGEVCYAAQVSLGDTDFLEPVHKRLTPPALAFPVGNSQLKEQGFTKLVKRDDGVYENVTRGDGEARYMRAGDSSSQPDLSKKIRD